MKTLAVATPDASQVTINNQKNIVSLMKADREIKKMFASIKTLVRGRK